MSLWHKTDRQTEKDEEPTGRFLQNTVFIIKSRAWTWCQCVDECYLHHPHFLSEADKHPEEKEHTCDWLFHVLETVRHTLRKREKPDHKLGVSFRQRVSDEADGLQMFHNSVKKFRLQGERKLSRFICETTIVKMTLVCEFTCFSDWAVKFGWVSSISISPLDSAPED